MSPTRHPLLLILVAGAIAAVDAADAPAAVAPAAAPAPAPAAGDLIVSDVRLLGGIGRGSLRSKSVAYASTGATSLHVEGDVDAATEVRLSGTTSFGEVIGGHGGFIAGAEVGWRTARSKNHFQALGGGANWDFDTTTIMVDLVAGYALPLGPGFHLELTPFAGIGRQSVDLDYHGDGTHVKGDGWGTAMEFGLRGGAFRTFANRVQIGLEGRYGREQADHRVDISNASVSSLTTDSDIRIDQYTILVSLGYRL